MKKMISVVLALVLVLTMSITALAVSEGEAVGGDGNFGAGGENNKASTDVSILASTSDTSNISATVPLTVTLAVKNDKTIVAPTEYKINNTSAFAIKVTNVKVTADGGYSFVNALTAAKQMDLSLKPGNGTEIDLDKYTTESAVPAGTAADWNIAAGGTLKLGFAGSVWADDISAAKKVFTITYTIEAGTAG